jgi:DNA-directed RNA polymerase subunit RPC12/RpoP
MIRYLCPRCKKALAAQDREAGGKLNCPHCGQRLQVPVPPPNKTMLGELEDRANRTVLGTLENAAAPSPPQTDGGKPPPMPRTTLVESVLPADAPEWLEEVEEEKPSRRRQSRYDEDDEEDRPRMRRRGRPVYAPCPECGCADRPRQVKHFGSTSITLLILGIFFWPLIIVAFFVQEIWEVCPACGERLRQTGTGF